MAVGQALYRVWLYGEIMCKLTSYLQGATVAASVFTIAILSLDRFFAIKKPILFRRFGDARYALYAIIIVWVVSLVLMAPLLVVKQVENYRFLQTELQICVEIWPDQSSRQIFDMVLFGLVYFVPGGVIGSAYSLIGMELWKEDVDLRRRESVTSQCMGKQMMAGRKKVAKMLIALAIVFAICWLPYYIVSLYLDFNYDSPSAMRFMTVLPFVILLGHANSALNPLLYFYSSKTFRTYLLKILHCLRCYKKNPAFPDHARFRYTSSRRFSCQNGSNNGHVKLASSCNSNYRKSSIGSVRSKSSSNSFRNIGHNKKYDSTEFTAGRLLLERATLIQMEIMKATIDNSNSTAKGDGKRFGSGRNLDIPMTIQEESSNRGSLQSSPRYFRSLLQEESPVHS
ncbi:neuropeptide Y receptor type 6-like [Saccostrea echinata]|uniref:neuropeptide Y receptor type 6-like n=1 Tax=Saccostrea echinata TaxID=191078 RepID=UPI002A821661|nr:neuropeptide Y receptor type 6-like [Saccostrea echinata]